MSEDKNIITKITEVLTNTTSSVGQAFSAGRAILSMKIDYEVKSKTIDLLNKLGAVSQQQILLQELLMMAKNRIIELEKEVNNKEQWLIEKSNYELYTPKPGTVVYRSKIPESAEQKPHYLCIHCYESGVKSILQYAVTKPVTTSLHSALFHCHRCNAYYDFPYEYVRDYP
ncbi:hypothetical protein [Arsenophonus endosymbiont of Crataerina pallida]|uniref:hypothetical protein n=1 Tax=Arsenophonus endosymbiont of Crataerina pallida TaxID=3066235 RepID=UPI0030CF0ADF